MAIPLGDSDDVPPEWQYEERFWRRRLDGIALDTVKKRCYLLEFVTKLFVHKVSMIV